MWAFLSEKAGPPPNTLNKEDKLKHLQRTQGRVIILDIWGTLTNKKKIKTFCNTGKKKPPTKEEKYLISVGKFLPSLINEEVKIKTIMWSLTTYHVGKEEKTSDNIPHCSGHLNVGILTSAGRTFVDIFLDGAKHYVLKP